MNAINQVPLSFDEIVRFRQSEQFPVHEVPDTKALDILSVYLDDDPEFIVIDLDTIDDVRSRRNDGRIGDEWLDSERVSDYAEAMLAGDKFPTIVVRKMPDETSVVIGGNHRRAAMQKIGRKQAIVISVVCNDITASILAGLLNKIEGARTTRSQRIKHAAHLVASYGLEVGAAAEQMQVSQDSIFSLLAVERTLSRLASCKGISSRQVSAVGSTKVKTISSPAITDPVFEALAQVAVNPLVTNDELADIKRTAIRLPSEAEQIAFIQQHAVGQLKRKIRPKHSDICRYLTSLEKLLSQASTWKQLQVDANEAELLKKRLKSLTVIMAKLNDG